MSALEYAKAGVNIQAADRLVEKIKLLTRFTLNKNVKSTIGGYASLYALDKRKLIAASTDGVGTKLKLAFKLNKHNTVGIDLVAMSVNDILCVGAKPVFFLDYFATGKLDVSVAEQVLKGIAEGCKQSDCALIGGETAEMPDFYSEGEYDLAGFAIGVLDKKDALPKTDIKHGDALIGIKSSGCHSNGFSLIRKLIPDVSDDDGILHKLLTPTKIYTKSLYPLIKKNKFKALAHITGSGFLNIPRMSEKYSYDIQLPSRNELPEIFDWIRDRSKMNLKEMAQTFNLGIGMVGIISSRNKNYVFKQLQKNGEKAWIIGEVIKSKNNTSAVYLKESGGDTSILQY